MNPLIKAAYRLATRNPLFQAVLRHEMSKRVGDDAFTAQRIAVFLSPDDGASRAQREKWLAAFQRITEQVPSGTSVAVHTVLAEAILSLPPDTPGVVVECGAWKGASAAALSQVCAHVGRKLIICDSFEGLPDDGGARHVGLHTGVYGHYEEGMFAGSEQEVRETLERFGRPECCELKKGYFEHSLQGFDQPVALMFLDVDLASSTRDCLRALWPRLIEGGHVYSDDAGDLDVVKVFFDDAWWRENLGCAAPGFVGSGCGLPVRAGYSAIGYTRKLERFDSEAWRRVPFLVYPDNDAR